MQENNDHRLPHFPQLEPLSKYYIDRIGVTFCNGENPEHRYLKNYHYLNA